MLEALATEAKCSGDEILRMLMRQAHAKKLRAGNVAPLVTPYPGDEVNGG